MHFKVLGPLRVQRHGQDVTPNGRLQRSLLALLLAHAGATVSSDELSESLWGAATGRPAARLQLLVHRLRSTLDDPERLSFHQSGYLLRMDAGELDSEEFLEACAQIDRAGEGTEGSAGYARTALDLWRGPPFSDIELPELEPHRAALVERRLFALGALFGSEIALGHHEAIVGELAEAAAANPFNEHLAALHMTALWQSGRQAEALDSYRQTRELLANDLGIDPGAELSMLHQRILRGDHAMVLTPPQSPPPPLPHRLHGRKKELARLHDLVRSANPETTQIVVLTGTAGVGKTAVALTLASSIADSFSGGYLFSDLRGFSSDEPVAAGEVLSTFIHSLGGESRRLSPSIDERMEHFRALVGGRRMLIVLDNARSTEQVRPVLASAPGSFVIITSRDSLAGLVALDGAHVIDLERLSVAESFDVLAEAAGEWIRDDTDAITLIEHCARLPLALRIAAERVRAANAVPGVVCGLSTVLARLLRESERLDALELGGDPRSDVRAVLSWSYTALPVASAHVFRALGLVPGRAADVYDIAVLADLGLRETRRHLDVLLRSHLVDLVPGQWFVQHDLLRSYAGECFDAGPAPVERNAVSSRLLLYYRDATVRAMNVIESATRSLRPEERDSRFELPPFANAHDAVEWLDAERVNILTLARGSVIDDGPTVSELAGILSLYLEPHGHLREATQLNEAALVHARNRGDGKAEGQAQNMLASVLTHNADIDGARVRLEEAQRLSVETGDWRGEATVRHNLGESDRVQGDIHRAVRWFEEALDINRERHSVVAQAPNLASLALCMVELQRPDRAAAYIAEARTALEGLEAERLHAFVAQAECQRLLLLGHIDRAFRLSNDRLSISRRRNEPLQVGEMLHLMGVAERRAGRDHDAALTLELAVIQGRRTGATHLVTQAQIEWGLCCLEADPDAAIRHFDEALATAMRSGFRLVEAGAREGLAAAFERTRMFARAMQERAVALAIYRALDSPRADAMADTADTPAEPVS